MTEDLALRVIRTTIFSIVVPNKEPCSTHKIRMEYKDMEGEEIPFSDYGHRTLDDFLRTHPMLSGMMQDGKWVFTAKISERSANIQALVKGQKSKKKKGKKGNNGFARNNFSRSSYHGKPTLGQGDVRRSNGSQPFNRSAQSYRSFTPGSSRPLISAPVNSKLPAYGSQQSNNSRPGWASSSSTSFGPSFPRPSQPWNGTQTHLEEKKKNSVVIEPEKRHCSIPSLKVMYDDMTELLVDSFPEGIPMAEITSRYEEKAGVRVDPIAVFALPWNELIEKKFNSRVKIDNGKAVLTPTYITANNLRVRGTGERKKQELVTLADLGIVYLEDSSQEDEDEDEEEDGLSETASLVNGEVRNNKTSWRAAPSGYESMCSSVSSSVQGLNASPQEMNESVISEELDDLTERMRTVKVEVDQDCPRMVTISQSPPVDESTVVKKKEKEVKTKEEKPKSSRSLFSKLTSTFSFGNSSRSSASATPSVSATTIKEESALPLVTMKPQGRLELPAEGSYKSFSITLDSKEKWAVRVSCKSPYYRILGSTCIFNGLKVLQVIREEGPEGVTPVSIDFVKMADGDTRSAADIMATSTPHFTLEYAFYAH